MPPGISLLLHQITRHSQNALGSPELLCFCARCLPCHQNALSNLTCQKTPSHSSKSRSSTLSYCYVFPDHPEPRSLPSQVCPDVFSSGWKLVIHVIRYEWAPPGPAQLLGSPFSSQRKQWLMVGYGMHATPTPAWVEHSLTNVKASRPAFTQSQKTASWTLSLKTVRPEARGLLA